MHNRSIVRTACGLIRKKNWETWESSFLPAEKVTLGFFEVQQCNVTVTAAPGAPGAPWDQLTQAGSGAAENNGITSVKRLWSTCAIGIKTTRVGHKRDFHIGLENLQKRWKCWCPVYSPFQSKRRSVISNQAEACVEGGLRLDKHRRSESVVESTISSIQFKEE